MSRVTSNDAVSYHQLAPLFDGLSIGVGIFDRYVTTSVCSIVIDGTKGEVSVCVEATYPVNVACDEDAAAVAASRCIARDGAVAQSERAGAVVVDAAASGAGSRCIARVGAIAHVDRAVVVDAAAAAVASRRIA